MACAVQNAEKGSAKLNLIITLVILGAMGFAGIRIVPVYFADYQFKDSLNSESRFALTGYPKRSAEDVKDDIFKKAQDLGIPAKRDDIVVAMDNGSVSISLDYSVPIDLIVYQYTLQFHDHADNHSI
jgi:hypothetical protein